MSQDAEGSRSSSTALRIEAARYRLGVASCVDLVKAAEAALSSGLESQSLVFLAGEANPALQDVAPLFERTLRELGMDVPDEAKACWIVIRHHMERIVEREVEPLDGVRAILNEVFDRAGLDGQSKQFLGDSHDLHRVLGNFYGVDDIRDRPAEVSVNGKYGEEATAEVEEHLRELASRWLVDNAERSL